MLQSKSRPKRWFLGPRFVGEGIPQISDMHFQFALTSMWPVLIEFPSAKAEITWRKRKKENSLVKYKSANSYVGRPNYELH